MDVERAFAGEQHIIPPGYADELVRMMVERGVAETKVLNGTGVTLDRLSDPRTRLSLGQLRRLSDNAVTASSEAGLGLEFGARVHVSRLGFLGYAMMSSKDLGEALGLAVKYHRLLSPFCELKLELEHGVAILALEETVELENPAFVKESVAACLLGQAHFILDRPLPLQEVRFNHAAPLDRSRYDTHFGCPVVFDAPRTELRFDASELQQPVRFSCASAARMAEEQCARLAAPLLSDDDIVGRVGGALRSRLDDPPDAEGTARLMGMSKRSLARALQARGTSFQQILDSVRKDRALEYLTSTSLPVEEIAQQLGFSSGRAFRRAFRKWTGSAPSDLRSASA